MIALMTPQTQSWFVLLLASTLSTYALEGQIDVMVPPSNLRVEVTGSKSPEPIYYIGTNATGLFAPTNHGTPTTPLDGSTQSNFEFNVNSLPVNSVGQLLYGTFPTKGELVWNLNSGVTLSGMGMTNTTIQFPAALIDNGTIGAGGGTFLIAAAANATANTVENMTLDCNYQTGIVATLKGVMLHGHNNTIRNIMLINAASFNKTYHESFGINIFGRSAVPSGSNNIIDNCVISNYTCNNKNDMLGFNLIGCQNSTIENSQVWQFGPTNIVYAYNASGVNILVTNNYANGVFIFTYNDSEPGATNLTYVNNTLTNFIQFMDFTSGHYKGLKFLNNVGYLDRGLAKHNGTAFLGSPPYGVTSPMTYNSVLISSNSINSSGKTNGVFDIYLGTNIVIQANTFFATSPTALETNFVNCGPVIYIGNSNFLNTAWP
jgi:hypothetical protein